MPPRPKLSKGCHACRRMKVKCDEQQPQCRRCIKAGRACPGFPEISVFLSMNDDFVPSSSVSSATTADDMTSRRGSSSENETSSLEILKRPSTDWKSHAVPYFFANFVSMPQEFDIGYLGCIPELFSQNQDVDCLRDAVHAVALTSYANVSSIPSLRLSARKQYGEALRSTRNALCQNNIRDDAPLLASILCIQKCETLNGSRSNPDPHEGGLVRLLHARGKAKPRTPLETNLLHTIHARLQVSDLDGKCDWADGPINDLTGIVQRSPGTTLWVLLSQVSQSCRLVRVAKSMPDGTGSRPAEQVIEALELAVRTEAGLTAWDDNLPEKERYRVCELPEADEDLPFASKALLFKDLQEGARFIGYWTSHIYVLRAMQDALDFAETLGLDYSHLPAPPLSRSVLQARMLEAADNICSSVPFMLGEIDGDGHPSFVTKGKALGAFFITRGLDLINEVPVAPLAQRRWALESLLKIGCGWGIGAALRSRAQGMQRLSGATPVSEGGRTWDTSSWVI